MLCYELTFFANKLLKILQVCQTDSIWHSYCETLTQQLELVQIEHVYWGIIEARLTPDLAHKQLDCSQCEKDIFSAFTS